MAHAGQANPLKHIALALQLGREGLSLERIGMYWLACYSAYFAFNWWAPLVLGAAWGVWFPVNKALWTSSYAVLTAGLALLVFAACYAAVELRGWRGWVTPFVVLGVNALLLFFLSTLAARVLTLIPAGGAMLQTAIFERVFAPWASPINASLAYAVGYVLAWWAVMWLLYRGGVRLRA